jgi:hypothetical protein
VLRGLGVQSLDLFLSRRAWTDTLPMPRADDSPAEDPQQVEELAKELAEELATQDELSDLQVARCTGHHSRPTTSHHRIRTCIALAVVRRLFTHGAVAGGGVRAGCWSRLTRG